MRAMNSATGQKKRETVRRYIYLPLNWEILRNMQNLGELNEHWSVAIHSYEGLRNEHCLRKDM